MSVEEDTELRELVSQTLENNGVLAKIRAELRARVFLAIEEQDSSQSKTMFINQALKDYLATPEGALGLCLVRELLEYLQLDFTLCVFNSETCHGKGYEYGGRSKLLKDLHISNISEKKGPLLSQLIQLLQTNSHNIATGTHSQENDQPEKNSKNNSTVDTCVVNSSAESHNHTNDSDSSIAPLDKTFTTESSVNKGAVPNVSLSESEMADLPVPLQPQKPSQPVNSQRPLAQAQQTSNQNHIPMNKPQGNNDIKPLSPPQTVLTSKVMEVNSNGSGDFLKKETEEEYKQRENNKRTQASSNPMISLSNLPPIDGINQVKKESKLKDRDSIFSVLDVDDHYEEDFQSDNSIAVDGDDHSKSQSLNHQSQGSDANLSKGKNTSNKGTNSPINSISEDIDDGNTTSGAEDFLNSAASADTMEATVSFVKSQYADYLEDA